MIPTINATAAMSLGVGIFLGLLASFAYFTHLILQVRHTVDSPGSHIRSLLIGAVARISILLTLGSVIAQLSGAWGACGYAMAFFIIRTLAIRKVHRKGLSGRPLCN